MSLFKNLLKLYPVPRRTEDFFTEIIVHLFNNQKDLAVAWLGNIGAISLNEVQSYTFFSATSQKTYSGLDHHATDSRPDIVIQLDSQGQRTLIFVESKVGSTQNPSQLTNYAEILCQENDSGKKILVYITRSFEAVDDFQENAQASNLLQHLKFIQTRWYLFYRFIDSRKEDYLIQEIKSFMREEKMNQDNQFSAADILAMLNFRHALSVMEETLVGEVEGKLKKTFPNQRMSSFPIAYKHYKIWPRLAYHVNFSGNDFILMLGYFDLTQESDLLYPDVKVCLQLHKSSPNGKEAFNILEGIVANPNNLWQGDWLDSSAEWPHIAIRKSLQDFLGEKDQVKEIQYFFLNGIDRVLELKEAHPELPWGF
ncbi:PD-(D/E)XK nuclease family protein [Nodosilinea sp. PGN35]|uniref:PD-(D/E)XK nuclease family protein n=1 Tax=Nodosilinea sp. PGN35 TaxID=3020489 RepID=UPI0023B3299A|nr:PD-(D/E)XK nuclease family protein [Nodosilinea sp. TSF1-S3]MDF0368293.1 hypothetical protein [Nodosilinea sp. TSF1-S3]